MELWAALGVVLWLSGWWFTGTLFGVYRKAIYLEEVERRREAVLATEHHPGTTIFILFDLGLLTLAMRSLHVLQDGHLEGSLAALNSTVQWSILVSAFLLREALKLHSLYHQRWRGMSADPLMEPTTVGTIKGLWRECHPWLRPALIAGPAVAAAPLLFRASGRPIEPTAPAVLLWFGLPQVLLFMTLAPPLMRVRRMVRLGRVP